MCRPLVLARAAVRATLGLVLVAPLVAQEAYRTPPRVVVDALDAPFQPAVSVSPDRTMLALAVRAPMPTIAELAEPMLRLAGQRINPRTNGPHRGISYTALSLTRIDGGAERSVAVPAGRKLGLK